MIAILRWYRGWIQVILNNYQYNLNTGLSGRIFMYLENYIDDISGDSPVFPYVCAKFLLFFVKFILLSYFLTKFLLFDQIPSF